MRKDVILGENVKNKLNYDYIKISKFLSLVLRHSPEIISLKMDKNGWVNINELINNANNYKNMHLTFDLIKTIVETNDKQRFAISDDKSRIRANQGHSITVDLGLDNKIPPDILYHGTTNRFLESIMRDGLKPMGRQYVHLSQTEETALMVGKRHGPPVILSINAKRMYDEGFKFNLSENKVWLVNNVPVKFINVKNNV